MKSCENFPGTLESRDTVLRTEETIPRSGEKEKGSWHHLESQVKPCLKPHLLLECSAVWAPKFLKLVRAFNWKQRSILDGPLIQQLANLLFSCSVTSDSLTPWAAAHPASLSFTVSRSLLKLMPSESVVPSNQLILSCSLLLLPSILPSMSLFQWVSSSHQVARILEVHFLTCVLSISLNTYIKFLLCMVVTMLWSRHLTKTLFNQSHPLTCLPQYVFHLSVPLCFSFWPFPTSSL